jgi:hypothetical protein
VPIQLPDDGNEEDAINSIYIVDVKESANSIRIGTVVAVIPFDSTYTGNEYVQWAKFVAEALNTAIANKPPEEPVEKRAKTRE